MFKPEHFATFDWDTKLKKWIFQLAETLDVAPEVIACWLIAECDNPPPIALIKIRAAYAKENLI